MRTKALGWMTVAVIGSGLVVGPAMADSKDRPSVDPDRYVLSPVGEDGFLRLDRQSGRVAECRKANAHWRCLAVPDAQLAMELEIERLTLQVAELRKENAALRARLKDGPEKDREGSGGLSPEDEEELNKALDFTETAMRRFFGLMKTLREEYEGLQ